MKKPLSYEEKQDRTAKIAAILFGLFIISIITVAVIYM